MVPCYRDVFSVACMLQDTLSWKIAPAQDVFKPKCGTLVGGKERMERPGAEG